MENPTERFRDYKKNHCWQYEVRCQNFSEDVEASGFSIEEINRLKPRDFEIRYIPKEEKMNVDEVTLFIKRHEWLGKMPNRPTHRFGAYYKGVLAGAIVMATPNAFSHVMGKENKGLEKLISRGACISWSPKGLGSYLVQKSINWMIQNTEFRVFSAYSDPEANELGTIYQALNFIYLGQKSGARKMYFDPLKPDKGWFSSREFRKVSAYKRYAKNLGIEWKKEWSTSDKMFWDNIPDHLERKIRAASKEYQKVCSWREVMPKHKYIQIKGRDRRETRKLLAIFLDNNPKLNHKKKDGVIIGTPYPKQRGK